ncbi:MAG: hypothetical protein DWQ44_01000 [Bacteroidetes bacterium]|mgnify:CR=1 FL=1|nr:MAG: hypothetical protein DWQ33_00470 [Bacteroidota bacterium]REK05003.1 MAG: hypothetical protein DWQ39_07250 [Bacteroidota bacterium]REK36493.1 MAG: hypothetical protein DWQ44_01000 [Bacteroidota bacterium]REK51707.1 MAG: hypothetical protein DWQ48_00750 [Bacteroidota bacterium]
MKIIKRILLVLAIILLVITAIGLLLPSKVEVERSIVINQPREAVFNYVNNLNNWNTWSPWHALDTNASYVIEGSASGTGAKLNWNSTHENVGKGSMTFTEVKEPESIALELNFMENGTAYAMYKLDEEAEATKFTWSFNFETGFNPLLRIMGKFMDGMIAKDFEKGLNNLKSVLESESFNSSAMKIEIVDVTPLHYLAVRDTADYNSISMKLGMNYGLVAEAMKVQGLNYGGQPFAIYYSGGEGRFDFDSAIPVDKPGKSSGKVRAGQIMAGKAVVGHHYGDYSSLGNAHQMIDAYVAENNLTVSGVPWEVYVTDPGAEPDTSKWLTMVYYPIQQ